MKFLQSIFTIISVLNQDEFKNKIDSNTLFKSKQLMFGRRPTCDVIVFPLLCLTVTKRVSGYPMNIPDRILSLV